MVFGIMSVIVAVICAIFEWRLRSRNRGFEAKREGQWADPDQTVEELRGKSIRPGL